MFIPNFDFDTLMNFQQETNHLTLIPRETVDFVFL